MVEYEMECKHFRAAKHGFSELGFSELLNMAHAGKYTGNVFSSAYAQANLAASGVRQCCLHIKHGQETWPGWRHYQTHRTRGDTGGGPGPGAADEAGGEVRAGRATAGPLTNPSSADAPRAPRRAGVGRI